MKNLSILIALLMITQAFAQMAPEKIQKDSLQVGRASTGSNKNLIFDTGDGASNKKLEVNGTSKQFSLNSTTNITGGLNATGNMDIDGAGNIDGAATLGSTLSVTGSSTHQSGLTLGAGTNATKQITINRAGYDPYLKWDEASQKWVFSNDGSVEKKFGSGSGGDTGITVLINGSWEDGANVDWTSSGGTYSTIAYGNPPDNDNVYFSFTATASGQYVESVVHAIPDPVTGGCLAKLDYYTTDASNWKLQVYDGSSNLLTEQTLTAKTWMAGYAPFPCPSAGTNVKMRIISLGAGSIQGDHAYLGKENRTFQVAQAMVAGESYWSGGENTRASTTLGALSATAAILPPTVTKSSLGSWLTTDADDYVQTINNLPAGRYKATFLVNTYLGTTGQAAAAAIAETSSNTVCQEQALQSNTASNQASTAISCIIDFSSAGNRTFRVYAKASGGTLYFPSTYGSVKFILEYFPLGSQTAITPEAQDWFIDVNIGGANPGMSSGSVATYTSINATSLDMVINSGSAAAKIPCLNSAAQGLTCNTGSIAEEVGIVFTNPTSGHYEACIDFSHYANPNNGQVQTTFQLIQTTSTSSTTIVQEGKNRTQSGHQSSVATQFVLPNRNCGTFYFSDVGEKTIRLMYEQVASNVVAAPFLVGDRDASYGQRDMHITVRPLMTPYNRPYLTGDQVTTPSASKPVFCSAKVSSTGVLSNQKGGCFSSCTNATTPVCTFTANYWNGVPNCGHSSDVSGLLSSKSTTATTFSGRVLSTAFSDISGDREYFCHGEKQ